MKRKLLNALGLAMAISMVGLTTASDTAALPQNYSMTYFYSDASHSEIVGYVEYTCFGWNREGVTSPYSELIHSESCPRLPDENYNPCNDVPLNFCGGG